MSGSFRTHVPMGFGRLAGAVRGALPKFLKAALVAAPFLAASCLRTAEEAAGPGPSQSSHAGLDHGLPTALAVPSGFTSSLVATGLSNPTAMAFAPDGRLFVCEQGGRLRIIRDGNLLDQPFLAVATQATGERGLLGVAFDPDFAANRHVFVYYTATTPVLHNRLSRFTASASDPDAAEPGSETVLLELDALTSATNHNGGAIHFGPDGLLYIAVGDNAVPADAQSLASLGGKLLRINRDGSIPADNPFYGRTTGKYRAIWALGFRNPFTFAFQPGTGRLHINDVGASGWEEINAGEAGSNYGWPHAEGVTGAPGYRDPAYAYGHGSGSCAIAGGAFYDPAAPQFPSEYLGDYFFADYCTGWIRRRDAAGGPPITFETDLAGPVDLKVSADGALYVLLRGEGGAVRRFSYGGGQPPTITAHPSDLTMAPGAQGAFTVAAGGPGPTTYRWQRDGADIPGATASTYTMTATPEDDGARYRAVVTNPYGTTASREALLTVTANRPPAATITAPAAGTAFRGGQAIHYAGTGSDPETGDLSGDAFTWWVDLHHDSHTHPMVPPTSGSASGSLIIPDRGETSPNIWYRIHLMVKDPSGLTHSTYRDILPVHVQVTLASEPPGLRLRLDGQAVTTPHTFQGVAGMVRAIEAVSPQALGGVDYAFATWSDGGARVHEAVPGGDSVFTARFASAAPGGAIYQAEEAAFSGPVRSTAYPGYTGTGFMDYVQATYDWVEFTVTAPASGTYQLEFRYALSSGTRAMAVRVNGAVVQGSFPFTATGSFSTWGLASLTAALDAGANTVRVTATGASGPNLDRLAVKPL